MRTRRQYERAFGFVLVALGIGFLALASFALYVTDFGVTTGFVGLLITGIMGIAAGASILLNAGEPIN